MDVVDVEQFVKEKAKEMVEKKEEVAIVEKKEENAIVESVEEKPIDLQQLQSDFLKKQVESGKTLTEITTDFAKATVTNEIMTDDSEKGKKYREELAEEQKETIKESFKQDKAEQQAGTLTAKQKKAEAFYTSFRPILEFDFSNLIKSKKDKNEEEKTKTYKDRSYGIPLMCLMLFLFIVPYCVISIVLAILNGINSIFEAIATFGKIARGVALTIFIFIIGCLLIYFAMLGIDALFGTDILGWLSTLFV